MKIANAHPPFESIVNEAMDSLSRTAKINLSRFKHRYWASDASQWFQAFDGGIADPPEVSSRQLEILNRGETLAKALALIQAIYLVVQLIARKLGGLPFNAARNSSAHLLCLKYDHLCPVLESASRRRECPFHKGKEDCLQLSTSKTWQKRPYILIVKPPD